MVPVSNQGVVRQSESTILLSMSLLIDLAVNVRRFCLGYKTQFL